MEDRSVIQPENNIDVDIEIRPDRQEQGQYQWRGDMNKNGGQVGYNWSYKEYIREQEEQDLMKKRMKSQVEIEVITIDDDN